MAVNYEIDNLDLKIISYLSKDAGIPYSELAKKLFVSGGTVHVRMRKLQQLGVVKGSHLVVDPVKLGYDITAFMGIFLEKSSLYDDVAAGLKAIPEVLSLHYTTGGYSMFAKILCRDTEHLRMVLHDKIQKITGIQRTETFIALEESINRNIQFPEE